MFSPDAVDGSHPTASQLLFLANNGLFGTVPRTSALPLKADVAAVGRESPKLNIPLEFGREKLK
jgi:hypothetical protein